MEEVIALIRQLGGERFYGALTVKFEAGNVIYLKKEETIKPTSSYRNIRGNALEQQSR